MGAEEVAQTKQSAAEKWKQPGRQPEAEAGRKGS